MIDCVKICCISSLEEANLAIQYGAKALGLVGKMPSGPGVISDELIQIIASNTPAGIATFLLTSETDFSSISDHHLRTGTNTIQLVDAVPTAVYLDLRRRFPLTKLVQVIHVVGEQSIEQALEVSPYVDYILLDSGNPNLPIKELGGTGRAHDWQISRSIKDAVDVPLFLAGGLNAENVARAIETVQPYGLDLCSSVRTQGQLDPRKLELFFNAISA